MKGTRIRNGVRLLLLVALVASNYGISIVRAESCQECYADGVGNSWCSSGNAWSSCDPLFPFRCLVVKGLCSGRPGFEGEEGEVDGLPEYSYRRRGAGAGPKYARPTPGSSPAAPAWDCRSTWADRHDSLARS
jgi:hypothetical protein